MPHKPAEEPRLLFRTPRPVTLTPVAELQDADPGIDPRVGTPCSHDPASGAAIVYPRRYIPEGGSFREAGIDAFTRPNAGVLNWRFSSAAFASNPAIVASWPSAWVAPRTRFASSIWVAKNCAAASEAITQAIASGGNGEASGQSRISSPMPFFSRLP